MVAYSVLAQYGWDCSACPSGYWSSTGTGLDECNQCPKVRLIAPLDARLNLAASFRVATEL